MNPEVKNDIYQIIKIIGGLAAFMWFAWRFEVIIHLLR